MTVHIYNKFPFFYKYFLIFTQAEHYHNYAPFVNNYLLNYDNIARLTAIKKTMSFCIIILLINLICRAPANRNDVTRGIAAGCSRQTCPRHIEVPAYCCFRQDLTGFTGFYCTGPISQRPLLPPYRTASCLNAGVKPCYSGLQVTGYRWLPVWHGKNV